MGTSLLLIVCNLDFRTGLSRSYYRVAFLSDVATGRIVVFHLANVLQSPQLIPEHSEHDTQHSMSDSGKRQNSWHFVLLPSNPLNHEVFE
jgi:hypothetical protein